LGVENEREGVLPDFGTVAYAGHGCGNKINPTRIGNAELS
jgi:hypothetical protein